VNNLRSQPLKVLFLPRINQIWQAQSSHCPSNEISFGVFQNERWLSGWFQGKSQVTKWQSGIVWSPFQVYKIILIPHNQQAETDSRLPQ
jgi:hypothetical protein